MEDGLELVLVREDLNDGPQESTINVFHESPTVDIGQFLRALQLQDCRDNVWELNLVHAFEQIVCVHIEVFGLILAKVVDVHLGFVARAQLMAPRGVNGQHIAPCLCLLNNHAGRVLDFLHDSKWICIIQSLRSLVAHVDNSGTVKNRKEVFAEEVNEVIEPVERAEDGSLL